MVYLVGLLLLVLLGVAIAIAAKLQKVMGSVQSNTEEDAPPQITK